MLTIKAKKRETKGRKNYLLRKKGLIPAVLYGEGLKAQSIQVDAGEIRKLYRQVGDTSLISLIIEDEKSSKPYSCLIYKLQRDPLKNNLIHVDFYHPSMKKKVTAEVPLVFEGVAPAVKEKGGVLVKAKLTVGVKGLVTDLPKEIKVDLTKLQEIHDSLLLKDLVIGDKLEFLGGPQEIVVTVTPPEAVEAELEEPIGEEVVEEEKTEETKEGETKKEEAGETKGKTSSSNE